jgi:hypothetical protein
LIALPMRAMTTGDSGRRTPEPPSTRAGVPTVPARPRCGHRPVDDRGGPERAGCHARDFGVTSRVAGPLLAHRSGRGQRQPGDRSRLGDVRGVDRVRPADLGRHQPDGAAADEVGQRVDEPVHEVAVLVAPPEHDGVHDVP